MLLRQRVIEGGALRVLRLVQTQLESQFLIRTAFFFQRWRHHDEHPADHPKDAVEDVQGNIRLCG